MECNKLTEGQHYFLLIHFDKSQYPNLQISTTSSDNSHSVWQTVVTGVKNDDQKMGKGHYIAQ